MRLPSPVLSAPLVPTVLVLLVLGAGPLAAEPPDFDEILSPGASGDRADQAAWSPDGALLGYRWDDGSGQALWVFDPASAEHRRLVTAREGDLGALDAYHWVPGSSARRWRLVVESGGDLFLVSGGDGATVTRLTDTAAEELDPKLSPDGSRVAFVREADLYLIELPAGERRARERALTTGGTPGEILHGTTDWVYWEEIWGRAGTGFWWSPDGQRIAYYRFEEAPVATYPLLDVAPDTGDTPAEILGAGTEVAQYPQVTEQKYPKTGTDNPVVRLGVLEVDSEQPGESTVWLETGDPADAYLARLHWLSGGGAVAVERLNREQNRLDLLRCGVAGEGAGSCRELLSETAETWVNVTDSTRFLEDGRFLWLSERTGWAQLYLYSAEGRLVRPLTRGERNASLVAVQADTEGIASVVISTSLPALQGTVLLGNAGRRLERVALDGGDDTEPALLFSGDTAGRGWHRGSLADGAAPDSPWLHTWSSADDPGWQVVRGGDGRELGRLPSQGPDFDPATLPAWEFLTVPGPEGSTLPARRLRALGVVEGEKAPAVIYHYGGPESQVVVDRWGSRGRDLWHKWMAVRGYEVLMVDNLASSYFGKHGADRIHRRFGEVNLAAQKAAVAFLTEEGAVDPKRIGLWGWSGGGSNTLYCLLRSPGTWKAGVSGAPVTDWRFYDTIWTERYLDRPQDNPQGYRDSSPLTHAAELEDALLIVHGTADDNVHPQNAYVLMQALIDAGLSFEDAIYPGQKHGFQAHEQAHFLRRMTEFFDRKLGEGGS